MKRICIMIASGCLLLLCSCTTEQPIRPALPADLAMNKGAGCGDELLATVHLENGRELLMIVDTGAPICLLDTSLEPILGKPLGTTKCISCYGKSTAGLYRAPKLYLGDTQLQTGDRIATTADIKRVSSDMNRMMHTNRPIMGLLGMDCLKNYCIQLDFAANKVCFLDSEHLNKDDVGRGYALTSINRGCVFISENLAGPNGAGSMIDTGCNFDGWLIPKVYRQWTNHAELSGHGLSRFPNGRLGGEVYPDAQLQAGGGGNCIGLSFLARHLVTFDFPHHTMYLKRTSVGRLVDE